MSVHECFYSVINTPFIEDISADKLGLPAGMADEDGSPNSSERRENHVEGG
jgi:hypothetical protein